MLRAKAGDLYLFCLDAENVRRLKDGKTISIKLAEIGGPAIELAIFYGETLADCARQLQEVRLKVPPHAIESPPGKAY